MMALFGEEAGGRHGGGGRGYFGFFLGSGGRHLSTLLTLAPKYIQDGDTTGILLRHDFSKLQHSSTSPRVSEFRGICWRRVTL